MVHIPVPLDEKAQRKLLGKYLNEDGTRCMSMKALYEAIIRNAIK